MKNKKKIELTVRVTSARLSLLFSGAGRDTVLETLLLRETSDEALRERVASWLGGRRIRQTLLILPRSEVLQKEMTEEPLSGILPYRTSEMAYGIMSGGGRNQSKNLLMALPEKKLLQWLGPLKEWGVVPDEIITEDQSFAWVLAEKNQSAAVLGIEQDEERILCVCLKEGRLLFSRAFRSLEGDPDLQEILQELSLALLEAGQKPERAVLAGANAQRFQSRIQNHFQIPVEFLEAGGHPEIPASLRGAALLEKHGPLSLLPNAEKVKKWIRIKKKQAREIIALFSGCLIGLALALGIHQGLVKMQLEKISREIQELAPQAQQLKEMTGMLALLHEFQSSKEGLLDFLAAVSSGMPSSVKLRELGIEGKNFYFKGETSLHGAIPETVQLFEKSGKVQGARLENTKLRKRLGEDYFEYEVSGQWKIEENGRP